MRFARGAFVGALIAMIASLGASNVRADDTADEADLQFELGAERYKVGDYLGALEHFLASNRLVPNRAVLFNIARSYEQLKRYPDAHRFYTQALEGETNAATRKSIEAALLRIAPKVAVLEVESNPPGATIYLDRKDLGARGSTPRSLGLAPGKYKVIAELAGYESATSAEIEVQVGAVVKVSLKLEPLLATVTVGGEAGAAVRVDSDSAAPRCTVPCTFTLIPGKHTLYLSREGYASVEVPLDVMPKAQIEVKPKMAILTGAVVVNADVRDALIEVDGKPLGFTPAVLQVPVGLHNLRISLVGFRTVERKVVVSTKDEARIDVQLTEVSEVTAASRSTESIETAPSSVTVVPTHELKGMGYPTIADALLGVRGVYLTDDRSYVSLGFRGFSRVGDYGNRVLVTIDGQPANDNYIGSSYVGFDGRTDLDDIDRIEVVRGPGSVLYGSNAFFGVVNLVTRRRDAPTHVSAGVSTVEYGVARGRVSAQYKLNDYAGIWTSVSGARSAGRDFYFGEFAEGVAGGPDGNARDLDKFDAGTVSGRAWYKDLTVQWFFTARKKTLPAAGYDTTFGDPATTFRDQRGFIEARFEPKLGDSLQWLTRAHLNVYDFRGVFALPPSDGGNEIDRFYGQWAGVEERLVITPSSLLRLTVGGEAQYHFRVRQVGSNDDGYGAVLKQRDDPFSILAGYLLADLSPSPRFKVSAGARVDHYSTFGTSLNPRLAFITRPWDKGVLKVMGGKAFRAPSVYELFYTSTTQVAPRSLKPEEIYSGEVELSHRLSPTVTATVAGYVNYVTNLVILRGDATQESPNIYENSNKPVLSTGGEVEVRRDFRQGWLLAVQASFQKTQYLKNEDKLLREVPNSPNVMAAVRGAVPIIARALQVMTRLTFVGPRWDRYDSASDPAQGQTEPALLWDVVFSGEAERAGVRYGIGIYNAFDWRYTAPVSAEFRQRSILQNGRTLYASAAITF